MDAALSAFDTGLLGSSFEPMKLRAARCAQKCLKLVPEVIRVCNLRVILE